VNPLSAAPRGTPATVCTMLALFAVCTLVIAQAAAQTPTTQSAATTAASSSSSSTTTGKSQVSDEALEKALSDKRYLMRQLKCALGEVPCDPVGKRLKIRFIRQPRRELHIRRIHTAIDQFAIIIVLYQGHWSTFVRVMFALTAQSGGQQGC
ncbi:uncharacterized protein LOC134202272, partial [Armigeres subalbatus]|uniref:uncharacterized protein LOC134202272 n=1 Tax=Armigeres subalbatus TaxID=124917 RepID=UPI002ED333C9